MPVDLLPPVLRYTSYFFPTTYVASALRASLQDQVTISTWLEIAGLCVWIVASLRVALVVAEIDALLAKLLQLKALNGSVAFRGILSEEKQFLRREAGLRPRSEGVR